METVNTVSLLVTVCDTLSAAYGLLFSAGLPECRFSVPAPEFYRSVASLAYSPKREVIAKSYPIQPVIQLSTGVWAAKKAGTQTHTD